MCSILILSSALKSVIRFQYDHIDKAALLFLLWAGFSAMWAWETQLSFIRWSILASSFITFYICRNLSISNQRALLWILAVHGLLGALLALLQSELLIGSFPLLKRAQDFLGIIILQTEKPGITMGHRNVASEYLLMCFGATCALLGEYWTQSKPAKKELAFLLISAIATAATIMYILCRGVIFGCIMSTLLLSMAYLIRQKKNDSKSHWRPAIILIFCSVFGTVLLVLLNKLHLVDEGLWEAKLGSIQMRLSHYSNSLVLALDALPQGVGLGNFALMYTSYIHACLPDIHYSDNLILKNAHSDPIETLVELGPIGLIVAAALFYRIIFQRFPASPTAKMMLWTILAQLINSFFNFPFQMNQTLLAFSIICGVYCPMAKPERSPNLEFSPTISLKIVVAVLAVFFAMFQWNRVQSHCLAKQGLLAIVDKKHLEAEPILRKAVDLQPRNVDVKMLLAYCLREMNYLTESSSLAENVLGIFPGYLPAHNLIGLNALQINDLNRAVKAFEKSHQLQPHQQATVRKLHLSYRRQADAFRTRGFVESALGVERKLTQLLPGDLQSQYFQIIDLLQLNRLDEAIQTFSLIPPQVKDTRYFFLQAKLAWKKGDSIPAMEAIEIGQSLNQDDPALLALQQEISLSISGNSAP